MSFIEWMVAFSNNDLEFYVHLMNMSDLIASLISIYK